MGYKATITNMKTSKKQFVNIVLLDSVTEDEEMEGVEDEDDYEDLESEDEDQTTRKKIQPTKKSDRKLVPSPEVTMIFTMHAG